MPEICRFYGIVIAIYQDDHNPPHFHARYGSSKVAIRINDLTVLEGKLSPRALGMVIEWAAQHQNELMTDWDLAKDNQPPEKIEPLKQRGSFTMQDVVSANYCEGYKIELRFEDGNGGIVDFSNFLCRGGVFKKFEDINFFKDFRINKDLGVITWNDEIDIAPESLYSYATDSALPAWMEP